MYCLSNFTEQSCSGKERYELLDGFSIDTNSY